MPRRIRSNIHQRGHTFIRAWREHRKLTQVQLGERIGTTPATISRLEAAGLPYTQDTLELIADALQTTPAALISRRPGPADQRLWLLVQKASVEQRRQLTALAEIFLAEDNNGGEGSRQWSQ